MKHLPLEQLEQSLGYTFARRDLLQRALTHSSFARESNDAVRDNERLEFLGDAVLQLIASEELLQRNPGHHEGELSKLRAHLVNARHLVHCAQALKLGDYLHLGRGEEKTGGRRKTALLADAVEALLAALYLDGGFEAARRVVIEYILNPELERLERSTDEILVADHKSHLQQTLRAAGRPEPAYEFISEEGPAHRKSFTMRVLVHTAAGEVDFDATGTGNTKKAATQQAAQKAIALLQEKLHG